MTTLQQNELRTCDHAVREAVATALQGTYRSIVSDPLPRRLRALVDCLEQQDVGEGR